jgi:hypothetical protein
MKLSNKLLEDGWSRCGILQNSYDPLDDEVASDCILYLHLVLLCNNGRHPRRKTKKAPTPTYVA